MNVVVCLEHRFERSPDGAVWTQTQYSHPFWAPYLTVFDRVRVVARVRPVPAAVQGWKRADGVNVEFAGVPYYVGPWQFLLNYRGFRRATRSAVGPTDAVILRMPSPIGDGIHAALRGTGRPYAVEVVADPYDVFAPGSVRHPLRPFFRWWFPRRLRQVCAGASAGLYVTREALQRRYPCPAGEVGCSDVEIPDGALIASPRPERTASGPFRLLIVGTLAQLYKAPDVLIDAVGLCVREGLDLKLTLVGDGKHRGELEARAAKLGLAERVCFRGQLTAGSAVREEMDRADLFVLPSYQEGLPRAMVEAMARGLPCVGSTVGGIPELLTPDNLVPPGNAAALAAKIREVVSSPQRLARMSADNLARAQEYRQEVLGERRRAFYRTVRDLTAAWVGRSEKCGVLSTEY